jgi:hypothetical protein
MKNPKPEGQFLVYHLAYCELRQVCQILRFPASTFVNMKVTIPCLFPKKRWWKLNNGYDPELEGGGLYESDRHHCSVPRLLSTGSWTKAPHIPGPLWYPSLIIPLDLHVKLLLALQTCCDGPCLWLCPFGPSCFIQLLSQQIPALSSRQNSNICLTNCYLSLATYIALTVSQSVWANTTEHWGLRVGRLRRFLPIV